MKEKGYTLIELLVAVLLIGLVLMLYMTSWSKAQAKARDGRRKADLAIVKLALEAYFNDRNAYPPNNYLTFGTIFAVTDDDGNVQTYMKQVPQDPLTPTREYCYWVASDSMSYFLGADFETEGRDPLWPCGVPGTPAPTIIVSSGTPEPSSFILPTQPPATLAPTQTPAPTPVATHLPSGNCSPCNKIDLSNTWSGYCCPVSPVEFYTSADSFCSVPPVAYGDSFGMTGCDVTCEAPPHWKRIADVGGCVDTPGFSGPGQQQDALCGSTGYGCGSVIDICTVPVDSSICTIGYKYTTCICM